MNDFERALLTQIGDTRLKKIQGIRVGIAGVGGLGSNCAQFLVRSGFRRFRLVDFDVVEWTNLNRQFYFADQVGRKKVEALRENLLRINPNLDIKIMDLRITPENASSVFPDCDVLVEALDSAASKKLLVETYLNSHKLLVCASGMAGWGNSNSIKTRKIQEHFYLVGDMVSEVGPGCPPMAPRVNIVAAKEADVVLSYVIDYLTEGDPDG